MIFSTGAEKQEEQEHLNPHHIKDVTMIILQVCLLHLIKEDMVKLLLLLPLLLLVQTSSDPRRSQKWSMTQKWEICRTQSQFTVTDQPERCAQHNPGLCTRSHCAHQAFVRPSSRPLDHSSSAIAPASAPAPASASIPLGQSLAAASIRSHVMSEIRKDKFLSNLCIFSSLICQRFQSWPTSNKILGIHN